MNESNSTGHIDSILTQTANKWSIPNRQHFDLAGNEEALNSFFISTHGATIRSKSTARYNCHGLTFGSRRTCIDDATSLSTILSHDGYTEVGQENVLAGDVILYFDETDGTVSHSGIVVEVTNSLPLSHKIVSKWGINGAEYIHWANRSPYGVSYKFYRMDYTKESGLISKIILA